MIEVKILGKILFESWMDFEEAKRSRSEKDSVLMKKIVLLPVRLLLIIQYIQGLHLPVLVPCGAKSPRPVLNRNLPEGSLLSTVSSPSIPFSRVQLLIYVNIPLYPSKIYGSRKCIKSRVWPDPFASSICNFVIENKVLTVLHIPRTP